MASPTAMGAYRVRITPCRSDIARAATDSQARRRFILLGLLFALVPVLAVAGYLLVQAYLTEQALREAIADADRLDPGWRLAELEANRTPVPPEKNSAAIVTCHGQPGHHDPQHGNGAQRSERHFDATGKAAPDDPTDGPANRGAACGSEAVGAGAYQSAKVVDLPQGRFPTNVKPSLNWTVRAMSTTPTSRSGC